MRAEEYLAARELVDRGQVAYYNRGEPGVPLATLVLACEADLHRVFPREVRAHAADIERGRRLGAGRDAR